MEGANNRRSDVMRLLEAVREGNSSDTDQLIALVRDELHSLATALFKAEAPPKIFKPADVVSQAFERLVDPKVAGGQERTGFFAIAAHAMRLVLVEHARSKARTEAGRPPIPVELTEPLLLSTARIEDVLAIDGALEKLELLDAEGVSAVELRFFGGLGPQDIAEVLDVPEKTVVDDLTIARAWLRRELSAPPRN